MVYAGKKLGKEEQVEEDRVQLRPVKGDDTSYGEGVVDGGRAYRERQQFATRVLSRLADRSARAPRASPAAYSRTFVAR